MSEPSAIGTDRSAAPRSGALRWLLAGQAVLALVVLFVPFGFDKRSEWGLDFGHLLVVVLIYAVVLIFGVVAAAKRRNWPIVAVQLLVPGVIFALAVFGVIDL